MTTEITPKIIYQTWKTHTVPKKYEKWVQSIKDMHPDYEYRLYDDAELDAYVKLHTPQFYNKFKRFLTHIERVDFFRYVILYVEGGVYVDLDCSAFKSLNPLVERNRIIFGVEAREHTKFYMRQSDIICNALMISPPRQEFWMDFMKYIIKHYDDSRWFWQNNAVFRTGPIALTDFYQRKWDSDKYNVQILSACAFFPQSDNFNRGHVVNGIDSISAQCKTFDQTYINHHWGHSWISSPMNWLMMHRDEMIALLLAILLIVVIYLIYYFWKRGRAHAHAAPHKDMSKEMDDLLKEVDKTIAA